MNQQLDWHIPVWQLYAQMKQSQRIPHAILLTGIRGLGKSLLAAELIASILCTNNEQQTHACGDCHSCQLLKTGAHPDHIEILVEESSSQIKIDQIRELKEKQNLTPTVSNYKTVLISPAEIMNISAANSLLKLLEEPQANTVIILLSHQSDRLPITITSRCQNLLVRAPESSRALAWLQQKYPHVDEQTLTKILAMVGGAPLAAEAWLDLDSDVLDQVKQDFISVLRGQANPVAIAAVWQQHDLLMIFRYLRSYVAQQITQRLSGDESQKNPEKMRIWWQIDDCILHIMKLLSSQNNFNKTLLIEEFIVSIKQCTATS
jgi:DNA polymerase-3 subunit delta'